MRVPNLALSLACFLFLLPDASAQMTDAEYRNSLAAVAKTLHAEGVLSEEVPRLLSRGHYGRLGALYDADETGASSPALPLLYFAFATEQQRRVEQIEAAAQHPTVGPVLRTLNEHFETDTTRSLPRERFDELAATLEAAQLTNVELAFYGPDAPRDDPQPPSPAEGAVVTFTGDVGPQAALVTDAFSTLGMTRRRLLDEIERLGLAPAERITPVRGDLDAGTIGTEVDLLRILVTGKSPRADRERRRVAYRNYLGTLTAAGLLTAADRAALLAAYRSDASTLLGAYCSIARLPDAAVLEIVPPQTPYSEQYRRLYAVLAKALPQLRLRDFAVDTATVAPAPDDMPREGPLTAVTIGFALLDATVSHVALRRAGPAVDDGGYARTYAQGSPALAVEEINEALAGQGVSYRLITGDRRERVGNRSVARAIAVALVNSAAADVLFPADPDDALPFRPSDSPFYMPSYFDDESDSEASDPDDLLPYPDHFLPPGSTQEHDLDVDGAVAAFREVGLLDGLTETQIADGTDRARRLEFADAPGELYRCFPRRVVYFDWEGAAMDGAYAELLRQFELAGRGHFALADVEDGFPAFGDGGPYPGAFTLDGRRYAFSSAGNGDWLDSAFLGALNEALSARGIGRFHAVADHGQAAGYAFFTDEALADVRERLPELLASAR